MSSPAPQSTTRPLKGTRSAPAVSCQSTTRPACASTPSETRRPPIQRPTNQSPQQPCSALPTSGLGPPHISQDRPHPHGDERPRPERKRTQNRTRASIDRPWPMRSMQPEDDDPFNDYLMGVMYMAERTELVIELFHLDLYCWEQAAAKNPGHYDKCVRRVKQVIKDLEDNGVAIIGPSTVKPGGEII